MYSQKYRFTAFVALNFRSKEEANLECVQLYWQRNGDDNYDKENYNFPSHKL